MKVVGQPCPTLCHPMYCSLPGAYIHGIFKARILEWNAISFSKVSSWPRDWTWGSCIAGRDFTVWATRKTKKFQARTLEWGTFPFPKGPSQPRDRTRSGALQVDSLLAEPQGKPKITGVGSLFLLHVIFPTQESNQCLRVAGRFFTNWAMRETWIVYGKFLNASWC